MQWQRQRDRRGRETAPAHAARFLVAVLVAAGVSGTAAAAAEPPSIGAAETVVRQVAGVLDSQRRDVVAADPVFKQEVIETGAESLATLRFLDGTTLTTGADSRVTLDDFVYAGGTQRAAVTVSKGIMRFVTGSMASSAYEVKTPTAIIGVRGTKFTVGTSAEGDQTNLLNCEQGTILLTLPSGAEIKLSAGNCLAFDRSAPTAGRRCTPEEKQEAVELAAQQKINGQGDKDDVALASANAANNAAARELTPADAASCTGC